MFKERYMMISYAHRDGERIIPFVKALENKNCRIWFDGMIPLGKEWDAEISERIKKASLLLAFVSAAYFSSENCLQELRHARSHGRNIFIIHLDNTPFPSGLDMRQDDKQSIYWYPEVEDQDIRRVLEDEKVQATVASELQNYCFDFYIKQLKRQKKLDTIENEKIRYADPEALWKVSREHYLERKSSRFRFLEINKSLLGVHAHRILPVKVKVDQDNEDCLLTEAMEEKEGHVFLIGQGGIGKTTALVNLMSYEFEKEYKRESQIPVYVELSEAPENDTGRLYANGRSSYIKKFLYFTIFHNGRSINDTLLEHEDQYDKDYMDALLGGKEDAEPQILLLLDGLNEVSRKRVNDRSIYGMISQEIAELSRYSNVRIVLTSRNNETLIRENVSRMYISGLDDETVKQYLLAVPSSEPLNIAEITDNKTLMETLRIPLFLCMYADLRKKEGVTVPGDIFRVFFQEMIRSDYSEKYSQTRKEYNHYDTEIEELDQKMRWFILDFILPEIAWIMENQERFTISRIDMKEIIQMVLVEEPDDTHVCGDYGREYFKDYRDDVHTFEESTYSTAQKINRIGIEKIMEYTVYNIGIIQREEGNRFRFFHHHFRDYFAALRNVHQLELAVFLQEKGKAETAVKCLAEIEEKPITATVQRFVGEYLEEHRNSPALGKGHWEYVVPEEKGRRNVLKRSLDLYRGKITKGYGLWNILTVIKITRNDFSGEDLSNLDLEKISLNGVALGRKGLSSKFDGSRITSKSIFPQGHTDDVTLAKFSRDGSRIVTASGDGTVRIWDSRSGECLRKLEGHTDSVISAELSRDGSRIVTASLDGTARVWDSERGECLRKLEGHTGDVTSAKFNRDGSRIVTASADGTARIWDGERGEYLNKLEGHMSWVNSAEFSRDGSRIVTASSDKTARIWDSENGECLGKLEGHTEAVGSAEFSRDGNRIVTASFDKTARIWDSKSGECLKELKGYICNAHSAKFNKDGSRIITEYGLWDQTVRIWDSESGECLKELWGHTDRVNSAEFSRDGSRIVTASDDETVRIWNSESGECLRVLEGHAGAVCSAEFSRDGKRIVIGTVDRKAQIWDSESGECLRELKGDTGWVRSARFSRDGSRIVTASGDGTAQIWDSESGECLKELEGHTDWLNSAKFSRDGSRIVTASGDRTARIWDSENGECLRKLEGHTDLLFSAEFSRDGSRIVTTSADRTMRIWNSENGECLRKLEGHTYWVISAEFNRDGSRIVTASYDGTARIWDSESGECLKELAGHMDKVNSVEFSRDGSRIVTASWDGTARIWDSESGECLKELEGHTDKLESAEFSRDGSRIVTASYDGTARIWDSESGECLKELVGHTDRVSSVEFSRDGSRIVTASYDRTVRIWDSESGECLRKLDGHRDVVCSAKFNREGNRIVTASYDGTARVWDSETGECQMVLPKVSGLIIHDVDLSLTNADSVLNEKEKVIIRQYGGII